MPVGIKPSPEELRIFSENGMQTRTKHDNTHFVAIDALFLTPCPQSLFTPLLKTRCAAHSSDVFV